MGRILTRPRIQTQADLLVPGRKPVGAIQLRRPAYMCLIGSRYGFRDIARGVAGTPIGTIYPTSEGFYADDSDGGRIDYPSLTVPQDVPFSIVFDATHTGVWNDFIFGNTGAADGMLLSGRGLNLRCRDAQVDFGNAFNFNYGRRQVCITHDGAGNYIAYYIDVEGATGQSIVTVSNTGATASGIENITRVCGGYFNAYTVDGTTRHVAIFKDQFSAPEAEKALRDFYAFAFKPANDTPYLFSVGGGATYTLTAEAGSYTFSGAAASLTASRALSAEVGTYTFTGADVTPVVNRVLTADTWSYAFTGAAADFTYTAGYTPLSAEAGSFLFTGADAGLTISRKLSAEAGSFAFSGADATLTYSPGVNYSLIAEAGSYTFTGSVADFFISRALTAEAGSYTFEGGAAELSVNRSLSAEAGTYSFTGTDVTFDRTRALAAGTGTYVFAGSDVTFTYSGFKVWTPISPVASTWTPVGGISTTWTEI